MEYFTGGDDVYQTTGIVLKSDSELALYCKEMCSAAKLFKNTVIFRCRQLLSANYKNYSDLQVHEQEVLNEFKLTEERFKPMVPNIIYQDTYTLIIYLK